ncbi:MAG: T9SS type A sorting domain-containing protein [Ignavibacteria bacterium]|nr:T9SS type A sorting domain-containing protein [Ignavibacteria bacterium]
MKKFLKLIFAVLIFLSAALPVSIFAQAHFPVRTDFEAGFASWAIATGDINGDGKQDMVCANFSDASISVFFNTTTIGSNTPSFAPKTDFSIAGNAMYLTLADINGDGKPDIIIANSTTSNVSVMINRTVTGSMTPDFTTIVDFTTGGKPVSVLVKDFNMDGKPDIAAGDQDSAVCIFINNTITGDTTAAFSTNYDFDGGLAVFFAASADFNGDGKPDIVSVDGNDTACVFINTTAPGASVPSFTTRTDFQTLDQSDGVSTGDLNLDGKSDFAVANYDTMSVFLNTTTLGSSTPSFSSRFDFPVEEGSPAAIVIADMNCDGKPDVITSNIQNNTLSVFINTTSPGSPVPVFLSRKDFSTLWVPQNLAIADINGDGKPDMLAANAGSDSISVFINRTGVGTSPASFTFTDFSMQSGSAPKSVCVQDFNGDGKVDLASGDYNNSAVSVFLNSTSPGSISPTFSARQDFSTGSGVSPVSVSSGDFNLDGKLDLAVVNVQPGGGYVAILINTTSPGSSTPSFSSHMDFLLGNGPRNVNVGDFNGDGKPDLIASSGLDNFVSVFLNTTTPGASTPTFSARTDFATGNEPQSITIADFNGDGKDDFATANGISFNVTVFFNTTPTGAGTPTFSTPTIYSSMGICWGITSADFNGDGKPDLAVTEINLDSVSVLLNSTTPGASAPTFYPLRNFSIGAFSYRITSGDVNGDGKPDLITANRNSNDLSVLLNATTPGTTIPGFLPKSNFSNGLTSQPQDVFIGDFNIDGKPDFAAANNGTDNISVFINRADFPLPVELTSFTASAEGQNVNLKWSTAEEINNKGFDIERNSFGSGWKKIGFVDGQGTVNSAEQYSFRDNGLNTGSYSYRLKQIDYNGNYKYYSLSNEVVIGVPVKFSLAQNYPNPFNPETKINYELPKNGFVSLKIYDMAGREVMQLVNNVQEAGYYSVKLKGLSLSSGIYFYRLTSENFIAVKKMVLVK